MANVVFPAVPHGISRGAAQPYNDVLVFDEELLPLLPEEPVLDRGDSPAEAVIFSVRWDVLLIRYLTISPVTNFAWTVDPFAYWLPGFEKRKCSLPPLPTPL
jgi:hypothetical protein